MKVGWKYLLHSQAFPMMNLDKPDYFVVVEVVEVRTDVTDAWTGEKKHTGLRAVDAQGKEYFCCWESFPSDSMSPMWMWYSNNNNDTSLWYDIVYLGHTEHPNKLPDALKLDFLIFCEIHHEFSYKREPDDKCWQCELDNHIAARANTNNTINWG